MSAETMPTSASAGRSRAFAARAVPTRIWVRPLRNASRMRSPEPIAEAASASRRSTITSGSAACTSASRRSVPPPSARMRAPPQDGQRVSGSAAMPHPWQRSSEPALCSTSGRSHEGHDCAAPQSRQRRAEAKPRRLMIRSACDPPAQSSAVRRSSSERLIMPRHPSASSCRRSITSTSGAGVRRVSVKRRQPSISARASVSIAGVALNSRLAAPARRASSRAASRACSRGVRSDL